MQRCFRRRIHCLLYFGITLVIIGFTFLYTFSSILDYFVTKSLTLKNGSQAYDSWRKTDPLTMDIYMFNWTNPEDIYNPNIKPNFVETGPYRFKNVREKVNITWNDHNDTVTYNQFLHYEYVNDSPTNYSDIITTINMVAWSAAHLSKNAGFWAKQSTMTALLFSPMFVRRSVKELLFDGYTDPLVSVANAMSFFTGEDTPDKFGFLYTSNSSIGRDGVFNVRTATDGEFGVMKNWNYENKIPYYNDTCAKIHGSASEFYPRNLKPDYITYFCTEVCRALEFTYEENVTVKGIPSYKYSAKDKAFDNGTLIEENKCYCSEYCQPSGVIDMSKCNQGLPVYTSLPHFYYGDPYYTNAIEGMHPEKEKHEFYFSLEPSIGVITDTAARVQFNLLLEPMWEYGLYRNVPKIMFPVFWTEHKVLLYDRYASGVRLLLILPRASVIFSIVLIFLGVVCVIYALTRLFYEKKKTANKKPSKEEIPLKA